jgi:hypothetical protein
MACSHARAMRAEARNLDNLILRQSHVLFLKFHNEAIRQLATNAALAAATENLGAGQKILQRPQQKRTETPALRIGRLEKISFQDHDEKILGQVLRVGRGIAAAINESENWPPINLAKLREAGIDLASGAGHTALTDQLQRVVTKWVRAPGLSTAQSA